jgi:hypothetical protein
MTYAEKIHCAQLYCEDCIRVEECVSKFECGQTCNCCRYQLLSEKFQSIEKKEGAEIQRWLFKDLNDYSEIKRRKPMTRLDRVLNLLEKYDDLPINKFNCPEAEFKKYFKEN